MPGIFSVKHTGSLWISKCVSELCLAIYLISGQTLQIFPAMVECPYSALLSFQGPLHARQALYYSATTLANLDEAGLN